MPEGEPFRQREYHRQRLRERGAPGLLRMLKRPRGQKKRARGTVTDQKGS